MNEILNRDLGMDNFTFIENETGVKKCECSDITHDDYSYSYFLFNLIVVIVVLPVVSVFGMFSNVCNAFIYSRKSMINSANTYLMSLACSDFFVIFTGLFIFWIDSARSYLPTLKQAPYVIVHTLPLGYLAQTCSVYFTVMAAVDCYFKACLAKYAGSYCTVRRARQICFGVLLLSGIYSYPRIDQFNLQECVPDFNTTETVIEVCPTPFFYKINEIYNVYSYMILMTFLPFFLLLVLNMLIVGNQIKQSRNKKRLQQRKSTSCNRSLQSGIDHSTAQLEDSTGGDDTITMIMVVVMFLCCNTLALVVNLIETFGKPSPLLLNFLSDGSNFLVIFNSSVNIVIYLFFSPEYRKLFLYYFSCCCSSQSRWSTRRRHRLQHRTQQQHNLSCSCQVPVANGTMKHYDHQSTNQRRCCTGGDSVGARIPLSQETQHLLLLNSSTTATAIRGGAQHAYAYNGHNGNVSSVVANGNGRNVNGLKLLIPVSDVNHDDQDEFLPEFQADLTWPPSPFSADSDRDRELYTSVLAKCENGKFANLTTQHGRKRKAIHVHKYNNNNNNNGFGSNKADKEDSSLYWDGVSSSRHKTTLSSANDFCSSDAHF